MFKHHTQYAARIALFLAGLTLLGACDRMPTVPDQNRSAAKTLEPARLEIEGDTLSCRSGWQVVDGKYSCM